jgi:SPP1 gp7 family putative phage head morphogenesis protein
MTDIYKVADRFRSRLLSHDEKASGEVADAYLLAYRRIRPQIDKLITQIRLARLSGGIVDTAWLVARRDRLEALQQQIVTELTHFAPQAARLTSNAQSSAVESGISDSINLIHAGAGNHPFKMATAPGTRVSSRAVESIVGFASDGSPLSNLFRALGPSAARRVREQLITGVTLGYSTDKLASTMRDAFGNDMARALTIARTETLRAYREASRLTYAENADLLDGWIWRSARTSRTCALCWAMDGTQHAPDETMASHPNCRCVMIPLVKGSDTSREKGSTAFEKLPPAEKESVLGPAKHDAYLAGDLHLTDLVGERRDPRWGLVRYERSLGDATGAAPQKLGGSGPRQPRAKVLPALGRFATIKEAEAYARSLGISDVDFGGKLHIAHMTIETLDEMKAKGYPMPAAIKTSYRLIRATTPPDEARRTAAAYGAESDTLYINPRNRYWGQEGRNAAAVVRQAYQQKYLTSAHPRHIIRHEFGHMLHAKADRAYYDSLFQIDFSDAERREVEKGIGTYASDHPQELIAEMVAAMMDGHIFSPELMKWYHKFGGPKL